jgi:hypothetical protein
MRLVELFGQTGSRRIEDISDQLQNNMKDVLDYFSLVPDDSTDVTNTSHLSICIAGIKNDFSVFERVLKSVLITWKNKSTGHLQTR